MYIIKVFLLITWIVFFLNTITRKQWLQNDNCIFLSVSHCKIGSFGYPVSPLTFGEFWQSFGNSPEIVHVCKKSTENHLAGMFVTHDLFRLPETDANTLWAHNCRNILALNGGSLENCLCVHWTNLTNHLSFSFFFFYQNCRKGHKKDWTSALKARRARSTRYKLAHTHSCMNFILHKMKALECCLTFCQI